MDRRGGAVHDAATAAVVSVNVGAPRVVQWAGRQVETAIWKEPVRGRVTLADVNLAGDGQADRRVHGGADKAVYAYAVEDYRWWASELGEPLPAGTFGENLTTTGVDLAATVVGEVWAVGTARLAVTQPRLPCFKLGIRMGDAGFVERFEQARRHGVYLRVVHEGDIGAGDSIELVSRPDHRLTAAAIVDVYDAPTPEGLGRLVDTPGVPESWRSWAERLLARPTSRRLAR
jgi:MOSC domain-containing protein YiiM